MLFGLAHNTWYTCVVRVVRGFAVSTCDSMMDALVQRLGGENSSEETCRVEGGVLWAKVDAGEEKYDNDDQGGRNHPP